MAKKRWCVVEMSDCWALMDRLDPVPLTASRFPKDETGWRDAVTQLERADWSSPRYQRPNVVSSAPRTTQSRRQFSLSRFGILFSSAILGLSVLLPWAVIRGPSIGGNSRSALRGNLFDVMYHGWRIDVAWILVGLAALGAAQALIMPYHRITLLSTIIGVLALIPVVVSVTQVHTFTAPGLSHPLVSVGYGAYVALGGSLLSMVTWALFPNRAKRRPPTPATSGAPLDQRRRAPESGGTTRFDAGEEKVHHGVGVGFASNGSPPDGTVPSGSGLLPSTGSVSPRSYNTRVGPDALPSLAVALGELAQQEGRDPEPVSPTASDRTPPAGWYTDYADANFLRYWDGTQWTDYLHPSR
ncbi:MAG: DUF2510 domain-containing protein [Acidimicrobiales bacterium]